MPKVTTIRKPDLENEEKGESASVMKCNRDGKAGYKCKGGFCFTGDGAEEKAKAQGRAIKAKEKSS